ncbi:ribonuclease H-like domain-containing protein [Bacillus infantis]|uniref:ribonuclease H-like domain-containing protein n=1 Tax=Bacillus infantis TaxID=324767 RepID=UPI003CE929E7
MSLKNKLNRLKPHLSKEQGSEPAKPVRAEEATKEFMLHDLWKENGVFPFHFEDSFCLVREKEYPLDWKHGKYRFSDFAAAVNAWNSGDVSHPLSSAGHQPDELFFFDTETTGLGGGTGNTIFLLGHASVTRDGVKLKQHILPHPGAEVPLYKSFLDSVDYTTMVTYNGKAFDWPQVKTRHTLIREQVPKLPPFGHFDLYHASRRIWKHRLERLKLSIVEKEVLGVERKDDIPGFLAPMIYFDYVQTKNPEGMLGILKHNEIDILSLITLYTHLSYQLLGLDGSRTAAETYEVGRWFSSLGNTSSAKAAFVQAAQTENEESVKARNALAFEHKKLKDWEQAAALWQECADSEADPKITAESSIELAKYFEHRSKDLARAVHYAEKARKALEAVPAPGTSDKLKPETDKRIRRLYAKLEKEQSRNDTASAGIKSAASGK